MDNVYNRSLFAAKARPARNKLSKMGGIMSSSPELMEAQRNSMPSESSGVGAPMIQTAPMPMAPMPMAMPTPMPMAPMAMPTPMPTAPVPAPQPAAPITPMGFDDGGPVDITESARLITPTSIALGSAALFTGLFNDFLGRSGEEFTNALGEKFSSKEAAEAAALEKKDSLDAAVATKNTDNIVNTVLDQSGLPLNDESKQDFARTVFGMENVNDIDEINRRIADVAIGSTIGKGPDEFAQAVLLGLGEYKKTATARAVATASGGTTGFTKDRTALRAYQDMVDSLTRSLSDTDLPAEYEGTITEYAAEQALKEVLKTYPTDQIPPQLLNQGGGQPATRKPEPPAGGLETFLIEAQKVNPNSSVEALTEFYTQKYGG